MYIHMIWLGDNYRSDIVEYTKHINSDHEVIVWRNDRLLPKSWRYCYETYATIPQMKSDLLRLCALREYGGLYIDFDCVMKKDVATITQNWTNLTIPCICGSNILPGNILYCPMEWNYWKYVDQYVENYNNSKICILTFDDLLYRSLPKESYTIINDCLRFPSHIKHITSDAEIIRYNRYAIL